MTVDPELFRRLFAGLAAIGHGERGWNRLAWGPGEDAARAWFRGEAEALGLRVLQDPAGSLWAVEPGGEEGPWRATGSHVDTVADGGAYDGALGVVAGLVAVAAARAAGGAPAPLAVACLVDEEGPRFGTPIFASRALAGEWDVAEILQRRDAEGASLETLAAARGVTADGLRTAPAWLQRVASFVEVHVEQGRRLADVPAALGVATALAPRERWSCTLTGEPDHAGTRPMEGRRDALVAASRLVLAAEREARAVAGAVATVGALEVRPGSSNVIPGEVSLVLDVRAGDVESLAAARAAIQAAATDGTWSRLAADPGSRFDPGLRAALHAAARAEGAAADDLAAYAGHDAGVLARRLPAAMLFVRNPTGASHGPTEAASEEDCLAACAVLARALVS